MSDAAKPRVVRATPSLDTGSGASSGCDAAGGAGAKVDHGGADVATRAPAAPTSGTSAIVRAIPLRQAKLVHFVRHCEATSNEAAASRGREAYKDPQFLDAELSAKGIEQAKALRDAILRDKPPVDVVIVSPLNRALSTASIAFEGLAPFVAVEEVRERIGVNPCDRRRSIDEKREAYSHVDFRGVDNDDTLWKEDCRETREELIVRGTAFLDWLQKRPERSFAVVTHSSFLLHMLGKSGHCGADDKLGSWFENGEMRTMWCT